jgi:uncharacterized protein involved in exopolysaccharide biosynthesis
LVAFTVFVLVAVTGNFITLPKVYTAMAQIEIRPPGVTGLDQLSLTQRESFRPEFDVMRSPVCLLPVIKDLGLDSAWAKRVFQSKEDRLTDQDALAYMNKILNLKVKPGTNIIDITVSSDRPIEAANIANAVADRYKTMRDIDEAERNSRGMDAFRAQITQQQKVVDEAKGEVERIREHLSGGTSGPGTTPSIQDHLKALSAVERNLQQQQNLLDALNVRLQQDILDQRLEESPVRILTRAHVPTAPDHHLAHLVTLIVAGVLSLLGASFVEMILLFQRAAERDDN